MMYLSGAVRAEVLNRTDIGVMLTPKGSHRPDLSMTPWAADTGCFTKPESYDTFKYLAWLDSHHDSFPTCLFATAPDVFGDAAATLALSAPVLPFIRHRVPAALVAQNGLEDLDIPWDSFDCLFVGGSDDWKLSESTYDLVAEARRRGKWTHMGRVNSYRRFRAAAMGGYDSADGTYLAFGPDINFPKLEAWIGMLRRQPSFLEEPS